MNESLADIEVLALRCRSDQSKDYISEALRCYSAGAYRASIVCTWVAVVFDLIEKLQELALSGDKQAQILDQKFQTYLEQINNGNTQGITKGLEFERKILEFCSEQLQFFDSHQLIDLYRLRDDRHRCAHPSFQQVGVPYKPSAEQARLHIRNAIVHVLSRPPVQGRAALEGVRKIVASEYFPDDVEKAILQLKKAGLEHPTESLVVSAIDQLIFGFFAPDSPLYEKKQIVPALNALHDLHPKLFEGRVGVQLSKIARDVSDARVMWVLFLITSINRAWELVDQPSRDKMESVVQKTPFADLMPAVEALWEIPALQPIICNRIATLDLDELTPLANLEGVIPFVKQRGIDLLAMSRTWDRTNLIFQKIILQLFNHLAADDVIRIIELPTKHSADLPGANGYGLFINKVRKSSVLTPDALNQLLLDNGSGYLVPQSE